MPPSRRPGLAEGALDRAPPMRLASERPRPRTERAASSRASSAARVHRSKRPTKRGRQRDRAAATYLARPAPTRATTMVARPPAPQRPRSNSDNPRHAPCAPATRPPRTDVTPSRTATGYACSTRRPRPCPIAHNPSTGSSTLRPATATTPPHAGTDLEAASPAPPSALRSRSARPSTDPAGGGSTTHTNPCRRSPW